MITKSDFNKAVEIHSDRLYGYMLKLVKDKDEAKNWVQEAFTILWENKDKVEADRVKSFLFTTAYRKMIDGYRREKRGTEITTEIARNQPTNWDTQYDKKQLLELAFTKISAKYKSLILLRDYEGYDYQSIAEISGVSLSAVKVNLFRARKEMKEVLSKLLIEGN